LCEFVYAKVSFEKAVLALSSKLFNINTIKMLVVLIKREAPYNKFFVFFGDMRLEKYTLDVRNLGQDALASRTRLMRMYGHHKTH